MSPPFRSYAATDTGRVRKHNEDAFADCAELGLWAVADGAGGHAAGEVASAMLVDALKTLPRDLPPEDALVQMRTRVIDVHHALREEAERVGADAMASTIAILLVHGDEFVALWAGDSRIYVLREGVLRQITRDHSFVQGLVDAGVLTEAQAERHPQSNVITRAIGAPEDSGELDRVTGTVQAGDRFLLCSDGVNKVLDARGITQALMGNHANPAQTMIQLAMQSGSRDNVTAIVVDIVGVPG
jgi:protein phosphatase/serine/threonine-protein phosphatase Stp1